jgi:hypothetical protein
MKNIQISKAQPTVKDQPVKSVSIVIDDEIRDFKILELQDIYCSQQAKDIETALYWSLPGSTYDRLFAAMCFRKASHFRVAHEEPKPNELLEACKAARTALQYLDSEYPEVEYALENANVLATIDLLNAAIVKAEGGQNA